MEIYILLCDYVFIVGAYSTLAAAQAFVGDPDAQDKWEYKEGVWSWQREGKDTSGYYEIIQKLLDD
jgi:hypothetical protein